MKKILLTLTAVAAAALTSYAQGIVQFNNLVSGNTVTKLPGGAYVGSDYSIQLVYAAGNLDAIQFAAAVKSSSTPVAFFGATGGNPGVDGAGLFDGGLINAGPAGVYTAIAQAWFNNGTYATYSAAALAGQNIGQSALFTFTAAASPAPPGDAYPAAFTVSSVPEPGTLALAGLGAASLLLFRRKK